MKREIKFRAWDGIRMTQSGIMYNNTTGKLEVPIGSKMKLMEFTGLTDKNGKEIYEGDVVKILYSDWMSKLDSDTRTLDEYLNDIAAKGVIEYKDCEFGVKICSDLLDPIHCGRHGFIEVIGNIYENPNILSND